MLRIGALACLPLLGGCAGQFAAVDASPPRVDVPEPGNGRTVPGTRAPAPAQPQPSAAKVYPARPGRDCRDATGLPGRAIAASGPGVAFHAIRSRRRRRRRRCRCRALPSRAAGSEDSFTIESPDAGGPAGSAGGAGQIDLQAPPPSANTAVNTLLAQAATERRGGNLDAAIAAAERALRIAPADPAVYCELATLRLERGDYALAEQLARKGLSYQPDAQMQQRLNAIIERARRGKTG